MNHFDSLRSIASLPINRLTWLGHVSEKSRVLRLYRLVRWKMLQSFKEREAEDINDIPISIYLTEPPIQDR